MSELTRHTLDVLAHGLALKDRVAAGEPLLIDAEHARLKQLLMADGAVAGHPDYGDSSPRPVPFDTREFLGVRYALACWLDEIFISDPACPWNQDWKDRALESDVYGGSQERAWRFWVMADKALKRPGTDAVEAYLWCVVLGFRGDPRVGISPPDWVNQARQRVQAAKQQEFRLPADLGLRTHVPPLRGRDRFRTAARVLLLVAAAGLFAATTLAVQRLSQG
jgi:type VI secretion system protein ImpK